MADKIVVLVTCGSNEEAKKIADELVQSKLVACVNILASVQSVFYWEGKACDEQETLLIIKSVKRNLHEVIRKVTDIHSYDVPEVIALPIVAGSQEYLSWVEEESRGRTNK
ncbi:divalent-cation tolerance protein CutA [candidate division KSB1 bacterium]|nr:divalent-cation tolerance protein CutA [candidate division KSB1 bacterium]NIR71821.1 divalent-cation tolerance protein CutA [candidate division KSB1 bacterium]NIS25337.1 divalent-cation tolerance protein CutA [candidate division KSB1 bacterium]NIT71807.1 divalent-cation tolerance protein CutA [candidate division KSB1 bacterium]NIU25545.1 divalent-cation tolerance protein CutA [candidate division KSB1 bacterium]